ncbi:MAG TPA: sulfite exporter TauE/SafE family protein [Candidatus Binatia bacterium]|nr:sulfite exporter TauE/SafE family protein [Candidatus Binatia bacterium]
MDDPLTLSLGTTLLPLLALAFLAGFIDSVAGGGGLVQVPALFILFPHAPAASLLGTNKFASIWGTGFATWQYARQVPMEWRATLPTAAAALLAGFAGAAAVAHLPRELLRPLVLVLLLAVLAYTLWRKDFGAMHAPRLSPRTQALAGLAIGAAIGFYDGFFGPGTGSFLIFAFVGVFGFSFLSASASAKAVNVVTNLAALGYFATHGHVRYALAVPMAACNVAGAFVGTRLALKLGSGFVRALFLVVVSVLICRYAMELRR